MVNNRKHGTMRFNVYSLGGASVAQTDMFTKSDGRLNRCAKQSDGFLNRRSLVRFQPGVVAFEPRITGLGEFFDFGNFVW